MNEEIEKRLQAIERIFCESHEVGYEKEGSCAQSPSLYEFAPNYPRGEGNNSSKGKKPREKSSWEMITDLQSKFKRFSKSVENRKSKMLQDQLDCSLARIFNRMEHSFMNTITCVLKENDERIKGVERGIQQMLLEQ